MISCSNQRSQQLVLKLSNKSTKHVLIPADHMPYSASQCVEAQIISALVPCAVDLTFETRTHSQTYTYLYHTYAKFKRLFSVWVCMSKQTAFHQLFGQEVKLSSKEESAASVLTQVRALVHCI